MGDKTSIEWTRGDDGTPGATWNPVTGCTKVSPGCDHCYAERLAERFRGVPGHYFADGFDVTLRHDKLALPLKWTKPRRVFVNSMSDLFHADVPDDYIAQVFAVMLMAGQHTFQVLTKRHARMRALLGSDDFAEAVHEHVWEQSRRFLDASQWPLRNVWLGVSVENQQWADIRIPALLDTPAAVRFLSCEPLLGPLDLHGPVVDGPRIDWVIAGGESGRGARPMHPDWARGLRDQCAEAGVPFHFKQWGEHNEDGAKVGKKAAGRMLDGRTWDEAPRALTPEPATGPETPQEAPGSAEGGEVGSLGGDEKIKPETGCTRHLTSQPRRGVPRG